jgi:hypothetical protein
MFNYWIYYTNNISSTPMNRKTNTALIALLGTILMGLSTWVLITLIELQTIVAMMQQELMSLDKVFGRIYSHMDRLANR